VSIGTTHIRSVVSLPLFPRVELGDNTRLPCQDMPSFGSPRRHMEALRTCAMAGTVGAPCCCCAQSRPHTDTFSSRTALNCTQWPTSSRPRQGWRRFALERAESVAQVRGWGVTFAEPNDVCGVTLCRHRLFSPSCAQDPGTTLNTASPWLGRAPEFTATVPASVQVRTIQRSSCEAGEGSCLPEAIGVYPKVW